MKKEGVLRSAFFGSLVRGEETEESDVDLLVEMPEGKSLFDFVGLKMELEKALDRPVDLVTYNSLHPLLKPDIEKNLIPVL